MAMTDVMFICFPGSDFVGICNRYLLTLLTTSMLALLLVVCSNL